MVKLELAVNLDTLGISDRLVTKSDQSPTRCPSHHRFRHNSCDLCSFFLQCLFKMKRVNFSFGERSQLAEIIKKYPVIEDKRKTPSIEVSKRDAWREIMLVYNSDENRVPRDENQIKVS